MLLPSRSRVEPRNLRTGSQGSGRRKESWGVRWSACQRPWSFAQYHLCHRWFRWQGRYWATHKCLCYTRSPSRLTVRFDSHLCWLASWCSSFWTSEWGHLASAWRCFCWRVWAATCRRPVMAPLFVPLCAYILKFKNYNHLTFWLVYKLDHTSPTQ